MPKWVFPNYALRGPFSVHARRASYKQQERDGTRCGEGSNMHEMALVHGVVDAVLEHAEAVGAKEVKAVHLTIGEGRDVVEDFMQGLFSFLARGTVAEEAKLIVRRVPYAVRCNRCGSVFPLNVRDSSTWVCPNCGAERDYRLYSGMEFMINEIRIVKDAELENAG